MRVAWFYVETSLQSYLHYTSDFVPITLLLIASTAIQIFTFEVSMHECEGWSALPIMPAFKWRELNDSGRTLARLFKDALEPDNKQFDFDTALHRRVSDVTAARTVDLMKSSHDLIDLQDKLASTPSGKFYSVNPIELLWRAVKARLDDYDIVIVDCPPNLGIVKTTVHINGLPHLQEEAAAGKGPDVFDAVIPAAGDLAGAAEMDSYGRTLKQKYRGVADNYRSLAAAILAKLEG